MASTGGISAWRKYYKGKGQVQTVVKGTSIKVSTPNNPSTFQSLSIQGEIVVVDSLTEEQALSYLSTPPRAGQPVSEKAKIRVPASIKGRRYLVDIDDLSKPKETGASDYKLQSANLISGATKVRINLLGHEDVECAVFKSTSELCRVVKTNLQANRLLDQNPNFKKSLIKYFSGTDFTKIEWLDAIDDSEKNQFAKYIGELVVGLIVLSGKASSNITGTNPFSGRGARSFVLPLDESFPGADSAIELQDGSYIPVSSKANSGAAASLFSNILSYIIKNPTILQNRETWIKKLYDAARTVGITDERGLKTASKKIVYEAGIRHILGLDSTAVPSTYQVYQDFKATDDMTKYSPASRRAYTALTKAIKADNNDAALRNLDSSTTVFLSKKLAEALNADAESVKIMLKILGAKDYYQANLQTGPLLKTGAIQFKMLRSGEAQLKIIGTKSGYNNIEASQGTLNYELKYGTA
jgi:hypothetical protein